MKILIDFSQIPVKKTGVGVLGFNLIKKISEIDSFNNFYILLQDDDQSLVFIKNKNFKLIKVKSRLFRKFVLRFLLEQVYIPYLILKYKIDIIHSLHYSFPIITFRAKKVINICDMTFFRFPDYHIFFKKYYFRFFIYLASKLADQIISISQSTSDDFLDKFNFDKMKTAVITLGKSETYHPNKEKSVVESVKNKFKIYSEYFLFIGTIEPRKNIKNLILAFNQLKLEGYNYILVITGKKGWHYDEIFLLVKKLKIEDYIIFTGFVEEEEKPYLLKGAKIFIYPSIYEGFGIPVLEAMSSGVPTITSNVSSLPEVAGEGAILINPQRWQDIYKSIKKLLSNEEFYKIIRKKGIEQSKKFTWEENAQKHLKIYKKVLGR